MQEQRKPPAGCRFGEGSTAVSGRRHALGTGAPASWNKSLSHWGKGSKLFPSETHADSLLREENRKQNHTFFLEGPWGRKPLCSDSEPSPQAAEVERPPRRPPP